MTRTEVRKECPSCGLGVPLEAKVCEFCGWDFEEEDEWISQIEKLEQELITEKQKFDDTAVDKMIKSSLHSSTGQKPAEGEQTAEAAPVVVKKKKLSAKGSVQVKIARPLGEDLLAEEKESKEEARPAPKPAPAPSKPKSVSIKVDVSKIPPPPEEFDLEEELESIEKERTKIEEPSAEVEEEEDIEAAPARAPMAATPVTAGTKTRRVRRVVSHPVGAPGTSPVKAAGTPAASAPKPAPAKAAPAKAVPTKPAAAAGKPKAPAKAAPAKPATPAKSAPEKEEKKGLFGRMFGGEKEEKPEAKPAPSKTAPTKGEKPSKPLTAPDKKPAQATAPAKPQPRMFQCPLCNTMVKEEDKACPNCGAEFE